MRNTRLTIGLLALVAATGISQGANLVAYDAAIDGSGFTARSVTPAVVDGSNSVAFDFGAISGDATFEFIVSGDPVGGGRDGFLAVGSNATFSLRYEQWDDTGQLGFTHAGVADYLFTPAITSPEVDTHIAYRYTSATSTMDLFVDGTLAGSAVATGFQMPTGAGSLGNNAANTEGMVGTISRVTTFDSALSDSEITSHANAWTSVPEPSSVILSGLATLALLRRRR